MSYLLRVGILGVSLILASCNNSQKSQNSIAAVGTPIAIVQANILTSVNAPTEAQKVVVPSSVSSQGVWGTAPLEVVRIANVIVDEDDINRRYVSTVFRVTNNTGRVLNNLHLIAMAKSGDSIGGTAVSLLQTDNDGSFSEDAVARAMIPNHAVEIGISGVLQINNNKADFQAYLPEDVAAFKLIAQKAGYLASADALLEYGFSARPLNSRKDRQLLVGESGLITVTMRIPKDVGRYKVSRFDMNFLAIELSRNQVTRQADESNSNAASRAVAAGAPYIMTVGLDNAIISGVTVLHSCNVIIGTLPTFMLPNTCRSNTTTTTLMCQRSSGPKVIPGPMISFVTDDARIEDYTKLLPLFKSKGLSITSALISSKIIPKASAPSGYQYMTAEQALELQANGWEILSHSRTHTDLVTLSADQIESELRDSKIELKSMGLNVGDVFVYPYGSFNLAVKDTACKYYKAALHAWGEQSLYSTNIGSIDGNQVMQIWRLSLGSFTLPGENTLDFYKARVDDVIAKKGWLIWKMHPFSPDHDATQQQYISDLIDYIKSKNVQVVSINDGLAKVGY